VAQLNREKVGNATNLIGNAKGDELGKGNLRISEDGDLRALNKQVEEGEM